MPRDGVVTVGAAGATNTQGKGGPWTLSTGTIPLDRGNSFGLAIEAANAGTGEAWPAAQTSAYVELVAALCAAYGLDPTRDDLSHREWCEPSCAGRKIDPAGPSPWATGSSSWAMGGFRADVAACSSSGPSPQPPQPPQPQPEPQPEEIEMPALIIQSNGGTYPGSLAVTDLTMTAKRFIGSADKAALDATGYYTFTVLDGSTFDGIPGDPTVDVIEGGR